MSTSERLETTAPRPHGVFEEPCTQGPLDRPGPSRVARQAHPKARVYILRCADGSYSVGSTVDLERRFAQHDSGEGAAYTPRRRPVTLVWADEVGSVRDAYAVEKQVQGWGRAKREALIRGDRDALRHLARRQKRGK